jgi:hypothetical protein
MPLYALFDKEVKQENLRWNCRARIGLNFKYKSLRLMIAHVAVVSRSWWKIEGGVISG